MKIKSKGNNKNLTDKRLGRGRPTLSNDERLNRLYSELEILYNSISDKDNTSLSTIRRRGRPKLSIHTRIHRLKVKIMELGGILSKYD